MIANSAAVANYKPLLYHQAEMIRLSDRLTVVFDNLVPQLDVWDFCCDHGYLGTAAYKSESFGNVYFVDQVSTIIEKLENQFQKYVFNPKLKTKAHFICQNGEKIQTPVCGNLCITGVGGLTIYEILLGLSENNFLNADRLILGPHRDDPKLLELMRNTANFKKYELRSNIEVEENERVRHIYIFDRNS